ncbi:MAG: relaxase/mobilization nuclease domain-containing protein [Prevotellaceae bacterium]|jgi:hypothetical protein|nr:relaxase/mobilization nuclease domain-containing protein [Prevotellaceae bacterium]
MIAKISSGNSLYGALAYNQNKVENRSASVIFTNKIIENQDGTFTMNSFLKSFEPYLLANKRTEKPVLHVSLNPNPNDKISDEKLVEIAQLYMQKMGYGNQPFAVFKHEDIERRHIHIVSARVDENGKKIDSNFERKKSLEICREIERKFNLIPTENQQLASNAINQLKPLNCKNGDMKHQISNIIRPISREWTFLSLKEYKTLLSLYNVGFEEVSGTVKNQNYRGMLYFALNEKGEKIGNPFKSSLFGKNTGLDFLEKKIEKAAETVKNKKMKERCKSVIATALQNCKSRADFENELKKQKIYAVFRTNEDGRIYGATFVDFEQHCVFNGSRLGKEFSANAFNDFFNKTETENKQDNLEQKSQLSHLSQLSPLSLLSLFSFNETPEDIEEQRFTKKLKKKKQRKI